MLSRARTIWRDARRSTLTGPALAAVDRLWWAHVIRRADLVDADLVSQQVGRPISARRAVRRYVRGGFRRGFTLNALFVERTVSRQLSDADRVPALYAYLVNDRSKLTVSPHWDAVGMSEADPLAATDPAGPLGRAWRRAKSEGWVELGFGDGRARFAWSDVARALRAELPTATSTPPSGRVLVCAVSADERDGDDALRLAADTALTMGAAVDLVIEGASFELEVQSKLLTLWVPGVRARWGRHASATAMSPVRGGTTAYRGPHATMTAADLSALFDRAEDTPACALWLAPDGTVASAGTVFASGRAGSLLADHPAEDARRLGREIPVPGLAGPARAWPAGASADSAGVTLTELSVVAPRAAVPSPADRPGDTDTDVDALLAGSGLCVDRWGERGPVLRRTARRGETATASRRWAIKTSAPAGRAGESWGETHFARGLAAALRRLGQEVVIDARDAASRPTAALDDVSLVLRGPHPIAPPTSGLSILWIISHPDEITEREVSAFDRVFAASTPWAAAASERFGCTIAPLLQCTDATRFHPTGIDRTTDIVFVGTARGIARPVVVEPLRAGVPVRVYGPDWRGYIDAGAIAATGVPNSELPSLYERAGVVLNDHWPAMQREGFVSNRLYDVVAAGGRAISDHVPGIADIFGGAVRTFRTPGELVSMLRGDPDLLFPGPDDVAATSAAIREAHSFDARARSLVAAAERWERDQADSTAA